MGSFRHLSTSSLNYCLLKNFTGSSKTYYLFNLSLRRTFSALDMLSISSTYIAYSGTWVAEPCGPLKATLLYK